MKRHLATRARTWLPIATLLAVAAIAFLPSLDGAILSWDDRKYLADSAIRGTTCFFERLVWIFTSTYFSNYNPLHRISYWIQHSLWGLEPQGYHAISIVLHLANTALVYLFARRLGLGARTALAAAAIFAVHPTRAETVAWISAQKDLGATLFALWGLCLYAPILSGAAGPSLARLASVAALFAIAVLWKSMLVVYPLLLLALDLAWRRPLGRAVAEKLPFFAISILFAAIAMQAGSRPGPIDDSWSVHAATALQAPLFYARRLLWPWDFSGRWWIPRPASVFEPAPLAGLLAIGAAAGILAAGLLRRDPRPAVCAIAWPAIALLPVSNIVPIPVVVADRYLYLAILGPVLAAAVLWRRLSASVARRSMRNAVFAAGMGLIAIFAFFSSAHCRAYRDAETLWRESLATQPENPIARIHLAKAILSSPSASARAEEVLALMTAPPDWATGRQQYYIARAAALSALGREEEAERELDRALELARKSSLRLETATAHASRLAARGKYAEAHAALDALRPRDRGEEEVILRGHLEICMAAEDDAGFLAFSERLLARDPFDLELWYGRSVAASRLGDRTEAARCERRLDALRPDWRLLARGP